MHPDLNGYWQFFGRIDVGEGFFFHAPVPKDTTRDNFDFIGLLHGRAGFPFEGRVRPRRLLGPARRGGGEVSGRPRVHRRRRRAQPSALWRLRPQQRPGRCDQSRLEACRQLQGWGGDTLLQSYSDERRPIFKEVAEDFIAARIRNDGEFLNRYNPARDKAEFEAAWKAQESDVGNRAQVYEPNYEGSPVVIGPPGGKSTAHGKHVFKARAGHHLAPQMLSSGRNVFEELGRGFTLLAFDAR